MVWSEWAFNRQPGLTVQREMHYFLRPNLKEFLEFCLVNFEVIFWTTAESRTLVPQYQRLLEAYPALGENRATLGRRWCDQSTHPNPVTRKYDNYLKRLDRVLTDRRCLGEYCHLRDYFLLVDLLAYRNVLNNPFSTYHPTMYHRKSKEEECDAPIPYFRCAVQPFLQGLLDSGKTIPQYCSMIDIAGRDFFRGTTSSPCTSRFFQNLQPALKSLHPQLLGVFHCLA